ncbi:hypothetical protein BLS_007063 [Venturia inaequalis]|uniref:Malic acid transport protein n=1 Tax=Venturia inaequalis TaxID=5025 RepID=A0A8H3UAG7_VENIN|nr:hypothetical protein BLS_007063 [Venturia inaequalis]KAE9976291.1 hypothetical protein EG328_002700 [Venturia inaequalis]KAE9987139.1 hypothetical protein EG327_004000 [Venturia inaequalis]RDI77717.1 hypothetical protein Vi05172_g12313 [Venturia inaequalis]
MEPFRDEEASSDDPISPATHAHLQLSVRDRISRFTWPWFACTMSTGAIPVLIAQQPFNFYGLKTIGSIFFVLDLVLFATFTICISTRFIKHPSALGHSLHHPQESFFFGTWWVSLALILNCMQAYAVPVCGPWLVTALEVCFWMYAGCAMLVAIFQYHLIFTKESFSAGQALPAWILPIYPFLVLGPLASALVPTQPEGAALIILIGGLLFQGLGWLFAYMIYTLYLARLITSGLPDESTRPGMYVSVGPAAYTSATLVSLGNQAPNVIPNNFLGTPPEVATGYFWKAFGLAAGIFVWLLGFWFFALTTLSILFGVQKMHFTLQWWAFIFPNAGLTLAAIQIGNTVGSDGVKGVTSGATILLIIMWVFVAGMNIKAIWKKEILAPGTDVGIEDGDEQPREEMKHD